MPLNLHQACLGRLDEILRDAVQHLRVSNGMMLDWYSTAALSSLDEALPKSGKTVAPLASMIDDRPASDFVADRISRRLSGAGGWKEEPRSEPLTDIAAFEDTAAIARDLVAEFDSLPWRYIFSMRLPHQLGATLRPMIDRTGRHGIGGGIYVADDRALAPPFPLPPGISSFSLLGDGHAWGANNVYLQLPLEGYADRYGASGTARRAAETLQTFIGLGSRSACSATTRPTARSGSRSRRSSIRSTASLRIGRSCTTPTSASMLAR